MRPCRRPSTSSTRATCCGFTASWTTEAFSSRTDQNLAAEPNAHYVLVSTRDGADAEGTEIDFRSYRIVDSEVTEEEVQVVDRYTNERTTPQTEVAP